MSETETEGVTQRSELASMGFFDHLEELRKRLINSLLYIVVGFGVCYAWHERLFSWLQKPIIDALLRHRLEPHLVYHNPIDPFNMYLKISLIAGIFVSSPFVLYQLWKFISPGLYRSERHYVAPFLISTVGLFAAGGYFAYRIVFPMALDFLMGFNVQFMPMVSINEYVGLFMTIVLGLGLVFEMPILVFFLALFGLVSPGWMWRNVRYSILIIFIIAGALVPTADVMSMCLFAAPMVVLYFISIAVAYLAHPDYRNKREQKAE